MKIRIHTLLLFGIVFFLSQCAKKEEEEGKQDILIRTELNEVQVDVPHVSWKTSLAVLSAPGNHMRSEMITDDIVRRLSEIQGLKVVLFSPESWANREDGNVDFLMKGQITETKNQAHIDLILVDVDADSNVWSGSYEEDMSLSPNFGKLVAREAAPAMGLTVDADETREPESTSPEALEHYMNGKSYLYGNTRDEINTAVASFKEALKSDSTYIPAYVGLADCYLKIYEQQWDRNLVWLRLAQDIITKVQAIVPNLSDVSLRSAQIAMHRGDYKQAETEFRRTIRLNANQSQAWAGLGKIFIHYGLYRPCLDVYERALELNPSDEIVSLGKAMILIGLQEYSTAEAELRRIIRIHPDRMYLHSFLALARYYQGDLDQATMELHQGFRGESYRPFSHAVMAMIHAKQGRLDEALGEVELEVKPYVGNNASLATAVAAVYVLLNRNGEAIQWLEMAISWGYQEYPWLAYDPNFAGLKGDERFHQILEELKKTWEENMGRYNPVQS